MLELSLRASYAILALACLEEHDEGWVLARQITRRTGISTPYLSKILLALRRSGLILAKRGYRGGFQLARPSGTITLLEIVEAAEGRRWTGGCLLGLARCSDENPCPAHRMWRKARRQVEDSLDKLTLADVARFERRGGAGRVGLRAARRGLVSASKVGSRPPSRAPRRVRSRGSARKGRS